jgi:NADH-ubiquinone oxidoreductase chain 5
MSIGMLRFDLGLFHLIEHGFFKALLFLTAGHILHSKNDEQDTRVLGSFVKTLPFPFSNLLNGFANLIATPCFAGFYSKELIVSLLFVGTHTYATHLQMLSQAFALAGVFFTCLYTFKFFYLQYFNNQQRYANQMNSYQSNMNMSVSMFILFYLSFSGLFISSFFISDLFSTRIFFNDFVENLIFSSMLNLSYNVLLHSLPLCLRSADKNNM